MSRRSHNGTLQLAFIAIPVLFVAIASLQIRMDAQAAESGAQQDELIFTSGPLLKKMSLGYDSLLADVYWTRTIQYYGSRIGTHHANFDLLYPLLDVTTTLDPKLIAAYRFGAIFLSEPAPIGAGRTDLAIQLVRHGIAANPEDWMLSSDLGFLYYWRLKDYPNAAAAYLEGSKNPAAPVWMRLMAARVAEQGGSIDTSRMIWQQMFDSTKDPKIRKWLRTQIDGLTALDDEIHLNEIAEDYRKRVGRYPFSTREMREAGLLPGIPVDPAGYPYVIGYDGKAHLAAESPVQEPKQ
jgi:hypothetical protein